jgi:hypothetical protein
MLKLLYQGIAIKSSRTFALKPPSMPSVADMMAKSLDPAHIVVGMLHCNEMISPQGILFAHIYRSLLCRSSGHP